LFHFFSFILNGFGTKSKYHYSRAQPNQCFNPTAYSHSAIL
jgi:hypothetical protein